MKPPHCQEGQQSTSSGQPAMIIVDSFVSLRRQIPFTRTLKRSSAQSYQLSSLVKLATCYFSTIEYFTQVE